MKYSYFKYIVVFLAFLGCSQVAFSQKYHSEGGVSTFKDVSERNSDGSYTITLETFAEGSSEAATFAKKDIVLVLDVSGSMDYSKGTPTATNSRVTYDMVASGNTTYFRRTGSSGNYTYTKVYADTFTYGGSTYYGLYTYAAGPDYFEYDRNKNNVYRDDLYSGVSTRMDELKKAVKQFIDNIELDNRQKPNGKPRGTLLGNRISIIKFAGTRKDTVGDDTYTSGSNTYNNTQIVKEFTDVDNADKVQELKDAVDGFESKGGTQAWEGMSLAVNVLENANANATKVVVFFTDGDPDNSNYSAIGDTNNNGGTNAYAAKNQYNAIVYSVGLFTSPAGSTSTRYRYLNYVSSNYKTAYYRNSTMNQGTEGGGDNGYYKDASGDVDLSSVFKSITEDIGRMGDDVDETSIVRDVVSSSFTLPVDASSMTDAEKAAWVDENVTIYTKKVSLTGTDGWQDDDYDLSGVTATISVDDKNHSVLNVTGFDFTLDDSDVGAGDGNWVGTRKVTVDGVTTTNWYGRKLVIEFNIVEADGVTGGNGTSTNTSDSGVWVYDENGVLKQINKYDMPHTDLPINIKIRKDGLRHGESATFEIKRASALKDENGKILYNDIGKPRPDESTWSNWSKVILTNKGADGAVVEKSLLALDPSYVYKIVEDDWGWAYELTHTGGDLTTATVEVNPFSFTNTEKTSTVKHAEAVTINHFGLTIQGGEFNGKQEEHYKSSKVETFSK